MTTDQQISELISRGNHAHSHGDLDLAMESFNEACRASDASGECALKHHALNGLGLVLLEKGRYEEANAALNEASLLRRDGKASAPLPSGEDPSLLRRDNNPSTSSLNVDPVHTDRAELHLQFARKLIQDGYEAAALDWIMKAKREFGIRNSELGTRNSEFGTRVLGMLDDAMLLLIEILRHR